MELAIGISGLVAGFAAALFGLLAWLAARQRQPVHTDRKAGRHSPADPHETAIGAAWWSPCTWRSQITSHDNAAILHYRQMDRDGSVILKVENISRGEIVIVRYRHIRPFAALTIRRKVAAARKARRQARRDELEDDYSIWKVWGGHLM